MEKAKMVNLVLTEQEFHFLVGCLDLRIRTDGLSALEPVVNLYNKFLAVKQQSSATQQSGDAPDA